MSPKITNVKEEDGIMTFTINDIDVSYVNAIRRTLLSDIKLPVFKTTPYEENNAIIYHNTTKLNNEIIKQRLSCIPVHIDIDTQSFENYVMELDVTNNTDTIMLVTTKDFKILDTSTNTYLEDGEVRKIFPPFISPNGIEYYIDFVNLRPKLSDEIPSERIKLSCKITTGTSREDSMFNATATCGYGCSPDLNKITEQLEIRKQKWKDEGKTPDEIKFEAANWKLLEGLRYVIKNSFDFILQSVGISENDKLMISACKILIDKLVELKKSIETDEIDIKKSDNILDNCYDIILVNEDYTIGNILNHELYKIFYTDLKQINYVGFKKMHPHDSDSILRVSLSDNTKGISSIKIILIASIDEAISKMNGVQKLF